MPARALVRGVFGAALAAMLLPAAARAQSWHDATPLQPPARGSDALAFDSARGRVVLFGGIDANSARFADTWETDGVDWQPVATAAAPPARTGHALAFDSVRARTVLFGGQTAPGAVADTWLYDGVNWTPRAPATSPPARSRHALAFDSGRGRTVLFGGADVNNARLADTWEFDGANWTPVVGATAPPLADHALAFDAVRNRTVLFGGFGGQGLVADTREYNGTSWTRIVTAHAPQPRSGHALAYDAARGRTVLFGGAAGAAFADTWEYDGSNWTLLAAAPASGPEPRTRTALAFDAVRGRTLLFGGVASYAMLADTWALANGRWQQLVAPPGLEGHSLTYDAARSRCVSFGGARIWDTVGFVLSADTWEYDGVHWTQSVTANAPSARAGHAAVYDAAMRRTLLFGGKAGFGSSNAAAYCADTWEYDGRNWVPIPTPRGQPPARAGHALAYDLARGCVVLFGGFLQSSGTNTRFFDDTWEWRDKGSGWKRVATTSSPSPRSAHALTYDVALGRTVLFGGGQIFPLADTWEYDGGNWQHVITPASPSVRIGHSLTYDVVRGRALLFGGAGTRLPLLNDAWEYDGSNWTQVLPPASPPGRSGHAAAYDLARQRTVVSGGDPGFSGAFLLADTWELAPANAASWTRHGLGCAGSAGTPSLDAAPGSLPALGSTFALRLTSLPPAPGSAFVAFGRDLVTWNGRALPAAIGAVGAPACRLWIAPEPGAVLTVAHAGGSANLAVPIPAQPALAGLVVGVQAFVPDTAARSGVGTLSNAGILRLR
jgi:hypothetical protein